MESKPVVTQHATYARSSRPLVASLAIVVLIGVLEVVGGIISGSLALLSDAGHMLVDVLALALALFAAVIARRPVTPERTYGYHRVEIMAALANGTALVVISVFIFYEAYGRFFNPPAINTPIMLSIATIGLIANIVGVLILRKSGSKSLNVKAALWHIIGDTVSSVGVIAGGVIIAFTGWHVVDPIIAVFIGGIIIWGAVRIVAESSNILLEAVPKHIQVDKVIDGIKNIAGVVDVHDIHIWTITSGMYALSAHLLVTDQTVSRSAEIVETVTKNLAEEYDIRHTTLQLECHTCANSCVCDLGQPEHAAGAGESPSAKSG